MSKYVIGIDEVGRGPLAGPVGVGVALVPADFDWELIPGVTDSKQLTEKRREEIYLIANQLRRTGQLDFAVSLVSATVIDQRGIVSAIKLAMHRGLNRLERRNAMAVGKVDAKLDGGLTAPTRYIQQETIVKGDSKERVIGLASVVAKVTRDRYMRRLATRPDLTAYDFAQHKGYGTKVHREAIATHGLSLEHRQNYCQNIKIKARI